MRDLVLVYSPAALKKIIIQAKSAGDLAGQFRLYSHLQDPTFLSIGRYTHAVPFDQNIGAFLERDKQARIVEYVEDERDLSRCAREVFYTPEKAAQALRDNDIYLFELELQRRARPFIIQLPRFRERENARLLYGKG